MTPSKAQIPEGWRLARLGEVAEVNREQWYPVEGATILYLDLTAVVEPGRLSDPKELASRYVDTTEPVEVMSVEDALAQLSEAERRRDQAVSRMDELLAELGYARWDVS